MVSFIFKVILLFVFVAYLILDLYLEYKKDAKNLHEEVQKLIKEQQEL